MKVSQKKYDGSFIRSTKVHKRLIQNLQRQKDIQPLKKGLIFKT